MSSTDPAYGPTNRQLQSWRTGYYADKSQPRPVDKNNLRPQTDGISEGMLYGSPIIFGSPLEYYDFNLAYYEVVRKGINKLSNQFPSGLSDAIDTYRIPRQLTHYNNKISAEHAQLRIRERNVKTRSFAGQAGNLTIWSGQSQPNNSSVNKRKSTEELSKLVLSSAVATIQSSGPGKGIFSGFISGAPNGFLISEAQDYDVSYRGDPDIEEQARLRSTYWPVEQVANNHPLRDLYDKFYNYGDPESRLWHKSVDFGGTSLFAGKSLAENNPLDQSSGIISYNYSHEDDPFVFIAGPFSQTELLFGNGNNIIAASPVMVAGLHRMTRSRVDGTSIDDYHTDTILYPSPVGQYGSNTLKTGNGNNLIYYDSSFSNITAGSGNNIFIPSFGSFNWSID